MSRASNIIVDDDFQPDEARKNVASWYTPGLSDGLGDRLLMFDNTSGSSLELLRFKREFASRPQFEDALRRRVAQLERFTHPAVATVRTVQSLGANDGLALVSNQTIGRRLSEVVREARGHRFALELLRQIVPALAALQDFGEDVSHGIITPESGALLDELAGRPADRRPRRSNGHRWKHRPLVPRHEPLEGNPSAWQWTVNVVIDRASRQPASERRRAERSRRSHRPGFRENANGHGVLLFCVYVVEAGAGLRAGVGPTRGACRAVRANARELPAGQPRNLWPRRRAVTPATAFITSSWRFLAEW